jgi:hypothetical protein
MSQHSTNMDRLRFDDTGNVQGTTRKLATDSSLEMSLAYILLLSAIQSILKLIGIGAERIERVFDEFVVLAAVWQFVVPYLST